MKTVMTNEMVAHTWAAQSQCTARNGNDTFYFRDRTIYSYGSHFPVARIVGDCVLITTQKYSVTTARHVNMAFQAVSNRRIFWVINVLAETKDQHTENFKELIEEVKGCVGKASRARKEETREWHLVEAKRIHDSATEYAKMFGISLSEQQQVFDEDYIQLLKEDIAKAQKTLRGKKKKRLAQFEKETLPKFYSGEVRTVTNPVNGSIAYLRVQEDGNDKFVFTSKGVKVEKSDAYRLWRIIGLVKQTGKVVTTDNNIRVAGFWVDKITKRGDVHAGCHLIKYKELEKAAQEMGFIKKEAL